MRLEKQGIATAAIIAEPFVDEALEQARALGMPDYRAVVVPHSGAHALSGDELDGLARALFDQVVERLTGSEEVG